MASELSRVATRTAFRSTSTILFNPAVRSSFISTSVPICRNGFSTSSALRQSEGPSPKNYSSLSWTKPGRSTPSQSASRQSDGAIKKPTMAAYKEEQKDSPEDDFSPHIEITMDDMYHQQQVDEPADAVPPKPHLRLVPRLGRAIAVGGNKDIARAFKLLDIGVNQNRVKAEHIKQKFHERPGKKRKRQRCERWVRKFRQGFKSTVVRVQELTKQGW